MQSLCGLCGMQVTVSEVFFTHGLYFGSEELSLCLVLNAQALPGAPLIDVKPKCLLL